MGPPKARSFLHFHHPDFEANQWSRLSAASTHAGPEEATGARGSCVARVAHGPVAAIIPWRSSGSALPGMALEIDKPLSLGLRFNVTGMRLLQPSQKRCL